MQKQVRNRQHRRIDQKRGRQRKLALAEEKTGWVAAAQDDFVQLELAAMHSQDAAIQDGFAFARQRRQNMQIKSFRSAEKPLLNNEVLTAATAQVDDLEGQGNDLADTGVARRGAAYLDAVQRK